MVEAVVALLTEMVKLPGGERNPVVVEIPVPPGLDGPFLVTSTKSCRWIARAFPNGSVRTAVRSLTLEALFSEIIEHIVQLAEEQKWGSVNPATPKGVRAVLTHLAEYGFSDVEVIHGEGFNVDLFPSELPREEATWVPKGWALCVPLDRAFVGTTFDWGKDQVAAVIHNASRGVGVVRPALR